MVIVFVLITYYVTSPLLIGKKFVDDVHTFYEDHGLESFRKDEYMFLFDGMPEMAGSYNGYPLVSQHYHTFFSATLPVSDLCFLILSWSLEHASIFLT